MLAFRKWVDKIKEYYEKVADNEEEKMKVKSILAIEKWEKLALQ